MSNPQHLFTIGRQQLAAGLLILVTTLMLNSSFAMDVDRVVGKVIAEQGGQVLDVQQVTVQHRVAYRIKLLQPSGRVRVLILDAETGEYLVSSDDKK